MSTSETHRDWDDQLASLERDGQVSMSWVPAAIEWLVGTHPGPRIEHVIDAGSGPGFAACEFAVALPSAEVSALDPTAAFLERARHRARERGVADRVGIHQGTIDSGLGDLPEADLVWSSHVVHHLPDPITALKTLGSWLAETGRLAIAEGGLPQRVLPANYGVGTPGFRARIDAVLGDYYAREWQLTEPAIGGAQDWPLMMREAGLSPTATKTFLLDLPAPVDDTVRAHIVDNYAHISELVRDRLDPGDASALGVLLDPEDPRSLHRRPDLFVLSAYTVHVAERPKQTATEVTPGS